MRKLPFITMGLLIVVMSGCNKAESPEAVANDVEAARQKSAAEVARVEKSAAKDTYSAAAKVDDKQKDLDAATAQGSYDIAAARAEGERKVALEKCMSLAGDQQKACKDQADAKHDLAVANAKAALAAQKP